MCARCLAACRHVGFLGGLFVAVAVLLAGGGVWAAPDSARASGTMLRPVSASAWEAVGPPPWDGAIVVAAAQTTAVSEALEPEQKDLPPWLLDPKVAYVLLLIGLAGLFFEWISPGAILPGVVGGLCLLLALYALSFLPINATGFVLLLFGAGLFVLELHITSFGLLSLAGVAALTAGSLLLFRAGGQAGLPLAVVLPTVGGVSAVLAGAAWILAKAQRQKPRSGLSALIGQTAVVRRWQGTAGKVFVHGELWQARIDADRPDAPEIDQEVVIVRVDGMALVVAPRATGQTPHNV